MHVVVDISLELNRLRIHVVVVVLVLIAAGTMVLQDRGDSSDSLVVPIAVLLVVSIGLAFGAALWAGLDKRRRTKFSTSRLFDERPYESAMKLVLERASSAETEY